MDKISEKELIFQLKSEIEEEKIKAIKFLAKFANSSEALQALKECIKDGSVEVRYFAQKAYHIVKNRLKSEKKDEFLHKPEINIEKFIEYLSSENPEIRIKAIKAAIISKQEYLLPYLVAQLYEETDWLVKPFIISALGELGNKNTLPVLVKHLSDKNPRVIANTIEAMYKIGGLEVLPQFVPFTESDDNRVRANATKILANIGSEHIFHILEDMINSEKVSMRDSAVYVLCTLDSENLPFILLKLLEKETEPDILEKILKKLKTLDSDIVQSKIKELKTRNNDSEKLLLIEKYFPDN